MGSFKFLRTLPWSIGLGLALTPGIFALGPAMESWIFPVVRDTRIENPHQTREGVSFYTSFRKARQCEFLSLVWYEGPDRLVVDFEPSAAAAPRTRPPGDQHAGPWLVRGLSNLEASTAYAYHRCHPLWVTISTFFRGSPQSGVEQ